MQKSHFKLYKYFHADAGPENLITQQFPHDFTGRCSDKAVKMGLISYLLMTWLMVNHGTQYCWLLKTIIIYSEMITYHNVTLVMDKSN